MGSKISKLLKKKRYDEALQNASTVVLEDIRNARLHKDLVIQWMVPRDVKELMPKELVYQDEAIQRFVDKKRGEVTLDRALAHYKLGLLYENMARGWIKANVKRLEEAIHEHDKALSIFPDFACALFRKGAIYTAQKKLEEGVKYFAEAGNADPEFCSAFFFQGINYKQLGDLDKSLESYEKAISLDENLAAAHANIGLIYYEKKEYELAERKFEKALEIVPNHSRTKHNLKVVRSVR